MEDMYCKICGGCGEDGCCSAERCEQHKDGLYCECYLKNLKFNSLMFKDTYNLLEKSYKTELEKIYNKNYDLIYKTD